MAIKIQIVDAETGPALGRHFDFTGWWFEILKWTLLASVSYQQREALAPASRYRRSAPDLKARRIEDGLSITSGSRRRCPRGH
jgi:hypothetical protein